MRVALMGRSLRPPLTGIGRYTLNLAREVAARLDPGSLTLFLTRDTVPLNGLSSHCARAPVPTPHELLRSIWEQTLVPLQVRARGFDIYHSPNFTLPLSLSCPGVLTIHDLAYLKDGYHNTRLQLYLRLLTSLAVKRASRIITVSEATRRATEERYPAARGKTSVVYPGLDRAFAQRPDGEKVAAFRERAGLTKPYVLFVGAIEPRKNLPRLVRAFERAVDETGAPHELVVCGPLGWRYEASLRAIETSRLGSRVRRIGYVSDEDLPSLYTGASVFAYPSLLEGFGFPPLEAMAMGAPVLTSDVSSLPEVAGDAAVQVSPRSVDSIAAGLVSLLTDGQLAGRLREEGPIRSRLFTWGNAAEQTIDVYRRAMEGIAR